MQVTIGVILYKNIEKFDRLWQTILRPTISAYSDINFEIIIADNSPQTNKLKIVDLTYIWNGGRNEYYAGGMNKIINLATSPYLVYLCSNHGRMLDVTWLEDLLEPLDKNVMTGDLQPGLFGPHIQGGVFAAQTKILKNNLYSSEYPHGHSDCWISKKLLDQDYKLGHVSTIRSTYSGKITGKYKFIHDY